MADIRDVVNYNEQAAEALSFSYDATIVSDPSRYDLGYGWTTPTFSTGVSVGMVSDSTVGLGAAGAYPMGVLLKVEGTKCSVQTHGTMQMAYLGTAVPIVGRGVVLDGAGHVNTPAGGVRLATEKGTVLGLDTANLLAKVLMP